jgi:hypothetical protein
MQPNSVQLTITVPIALASPGAAERARLLLVLDAVRSELMTARGAALTLGLAPSAFMDLARDLGVPVARPSEGDFGEDLATLERLRPVRCGAS